jgi:hypothetical protein
MGIRICSSWRAPEIASDNKSPAPSLLVQLVSSPAELLLLIGKGAKAGDMAPKTIAFDLTSLGRKLI